MTKEVTVTISFGTMFTSKLLPDRTDVIVDVGEDDFFEVYRIRETESGERTFGIIGGGGRTEHIKKIVGQMSVDEVISAAQRGWEMSGFQFPDELRQMLERNSQKEPRVIKIG